MLLLVCCLLAVVAAVVYKLLRNGDVGPHIIHIYIALGHLLEVEGGGEGGQGGGVFIVW